MVSRAATDSSSTTSGSATDGDEYRILVNDINDLNADWQKHYDDNATKEHSYDNGACNTAEEDELLYEKAKAESKQISLINQIETKETDSNDLTINIGQLEQDKKDFESKKTRNIVITAAGSAAVLGGGIATILNVRKNKSLKRNIANAEKKMTKAKGELERYNAQLELFSAKLTNCQTELKNIDTSSITEDTNIITINNLKAQINTEITTLANKLKTIKTKEDFASSQNNTVGKITVLRNNAASGHTEVAAMQTLINQISNQALSTISSLQYFEKVTVPGMSNDEFNNSEPQPYRNDNKFATETMEITISNLEKQLVGQKGKAKRQLKKEIRSKKRQLKKLKKSLK